MNVHRLLFRVAAGLLCGAPGLWVMLPVLLARHSAVPGLDAGDNLAALWNVWWFIEGTQVTGWPYWTPLLFAPIGTQWSLHTHATTHSLLAWASTPFTSLVAAHNIALTLGLVLNGMCAYALALRASGRVLGAVAAGILFGASAAVQVRALGHINLVHAWVLPVFALTLLHLASRPGVARAVMLGAAGALVVYTDYYYALYAVVLTALWAVVVLIRADITRMPKRVGRLGSVLLALILLNVAVVAIIGVTGGTVLDLGVATVSLRGLRNPLTLLWFLVAAWALWRYPWKLSLGWRAGTPVLRDVMPALIVAGTFLVISLPLWLALVRVIAAGDYTTQTVLWRSSPPGGDLLTLVLGHPRHVLAGDWTRSAYGWLGIDVMEQALWIGIVPLVLLVLTAREWRSAPGARLWTLTGVVFGLLALGPFLRIAGADTALPLPHAVLRYVPVFSNARIPGRAVVVVQLAVAVLLAHGLARRSRDTAILLLALVVIESFPARLPLQMLPAADAVDDALRMSSAPGAVAELPLGLRDGFSHQGAFDHRALVHQMSHGRALAGGFVARLAPGVRHFYQHTPILATLLRVSTSSVAEYRLDADAGARAFASGLSFLVINRDTFVDGRLPRADLEEAGFRFVQASGTRELYEVGRPRE